MIVVIEGESYKPYLGFRIFRVKGSGFKVLGLGVGCQIIRGVVKGMVFFLELPLSYGP